MAAAPVESSQSLSKRCPWGRLGSVLYRCKRLHRRRRRFKHFWPISLSRPLDLAIFFFAMVCFQGAPRALGCRVDGVCGTDAYPLPDLPREASRSRSAPEKSVQFGPDGAPFLGSRSNVVHNQAGYLARPTTEAPSRARRTRSTATVVCRAASSTRPARALSNSTLTLRRRRRALVVR